MPTGSFARRAARVLGALVKGADEANFTPLSAIDSPSVIDEDPENIESTVKVLEQMGYVEVQSDAEGHPQSIKLTSSGVTMRDTLR